MSRATIFVIVLIIIIGGGLLLFRRPATVEERNLTVARIMLTGHREDGSQSWSIHAQTGSFDDADGVLESVQLKFFEDDDSHILVQADQLSRDPGGSTLSGSIDIEQHDGMSLKTDTIFWDERNDVLEAGPVTIETESASIEAGAFHHHLRDGLTILTGGIEARLTQDNREFDVTADSAEATSDQLTLLGNVSIRSQDGDVYHSQRLESDDSGSLIHMTGDVSGQWQESTFSADSVKLDDAGIHLSGDVIIDLELFMMDEANDT